METQEIFFSCPYCWKSISFVVDASVESQTYIEDCENCCHPIEITYQAADGEILSFETIRVQ